MTPLPWLTRCTGTPSSSALSKTARSAFGPSTEGISTRHCPPSENRCVELGRSCRSLAGSPILSRNRRVRSIPLLSIGLPQFNGHRSSPAFYEPGDTERWVVSRFPLFASLLIDGVRRRRLAGDEIGVDRITGA